MHLLSNLPFSLDWLPPDIYLVGGAVRDSLLGRQPERLDFDLVLAGPAVATAWAIAQHYGAGFVVLDAERQVARVVFPEATVDFAQQEGTSLIQDLQRRDFTINAMAYDFGTKTLIDPLKGQQDLEKGLIRRIARQNLAADSLRLLRAYRQAAQLNFTLDPLTRRDISNLAPLLQEVAAERVQTELNLLLKATPGWPWFQLAQADGVLQPWLPAIAGPNIQRLQALEQLVLQGDDFWLALAVSLEQPVSFAQPGPPTAKLEQPLSWLALVKLTCLLPLDPVVAKAVLLSLKYSRGVLRGVMTVLQEWRHLGSEFFSRRAQYEFFARVGPVFPAIALFGLTMGLKRSTLVPLVDLFLDPKDPIAHPQPLVSGADLMYQLQIPPGPQIGKLLRAIQIGQAEGQVTTPTAALQLAEKLLQKGCPNG